MRATDISPSALPKPLPRLGGLIAALSGRRVAFIHTERGWRDHLMSGHAHLPGAWMRHLSGRGYAICFLPYTRRPYLRRLNRRCLHIYLGPGAGHRGPGVLTLHPGYVDGYWYLDPLGHRERSSITEATYDAAQVDPKPANAHFGHVRRASVKGGWTTREQPDAQVSDLPKRAIVIALQRFPDGRLPPGAICSETDMIRAIIDARRDCPILIKYHPFGVNPRTLALVEQLCRDHADVARVDVNVHDLLDAARVVCCFSSGVGFEAMLHRVPTILFATADYHHAAFPVSDIKELPKVMDRALNSRTNYPKYVYWFLEKKLFHADQADLGRRFDAILDEARSDQPR